MRLRNDHQAIVTAASKAWKRLCTRPGRIALRSFFRATLGRPEMARHITLVRRVEP